MSSKECLKISKKNRKWENNISRSNFTIYTIYRKKVNQKDNQQENMLYFIYDVGKTKKFLNEEVFYTSYLAKKIKI